MIFSNCKSRFVSTSIRRRLPIATDYAFSAALYEPAETFSRNEDIQDEQGLHGGPENGVGTQ
jgi:hypothetical protein